MLFYLFVVTGIHEQYYIFYRVKPLYYFQNPNHTIDIYFYICKNIPWPSKYKKNVLHCLNKYVVMGKCNSLLYVVHQMCSISTISFQDFQNNKGLP